MTIRLPPSQSMPACSAKALMNFKPTGAGSFIVIQLRRCGLRQRCKYDTSALLLQGLRAFKIADLLHVAACNVRASTAVMAKTTW